MGACSLVGGESRKHVRERRSDSGHPELSPAGDPLIDCVEYVLDCPIDGRGSDPSLFGLFLGC